MNKWTYDQTISIIDSHKFEQGDVFINKKNGNAYTYDCIEIHSETLEPMVSYFDSFGIKWTRPYELFIEKFKFKEVIA